MFQTIEVSVRDPIVREEIVAVLVGIESLDAHRPKFTSWHTPGDVIAGIDDNAVIIRIGNCAVFRIGKHRNMDRPTIAFRSCLRNVCKVATVFL